MTRLEKKFDDAVNQVPDEFFDPDQFVGGVGPCTADVILIGEAPGATEVEEQEPFVGRAGSKLDAALTDVGVDRSLLYITNVVKVRPPDNRTPTVAEIDAWMPVLAVEIEYVDPAVIILLGTTATRAVLDIDEGITSVRGQKFDREGRTVIPTFHPAAMFYDESKQIDFENDIAEAFADV